MPRRSYTPRRGASVRSYAITPRDRAQSVARSRAAQHPVDHRIHPGPIQSFAIELAASQPSDRTTRQPRRMSAFSRSDHRACLPGVIAFDGQESCAGASRRDRCATVAIARRGALGVIAGARSRRRPLLFSCADGRCGAGIEDPRFGSDRAGGDRCPACKSPKARLANAVQNRGDA
jgi:hypothetical protein